MRRRGSPHAPLMAVLLMGAVLIAAPLHGQDMAPGPERDTSAESSVIVSIAPLFPVSSMPVPDLLASSSELVWAVDGTPFELGQDRGGLNRGPNVALMAVGGTAIVVGLLLGGEAGTIIAVSGGVIGLIGLYRFVR